MTSSEFYRSIDTAVGPECRRLGLQRAKTTTSSWTLDLPGGRLFFEIKKDLQHAFDPLTGGQFVVHGYRVAEPDRHSPELTDAVSYMQYYTDADLDGLRHLRDGVLERILAQQPDGEFERLTLEAMAPILRLSLGAPFRRHQVMALPYLDSEDVRAWGNYLAARLEAFVAGVRREAAG